VGVAAGVPERGAAKREWHAIDGGMKKPEPPGRGPSGTSAIAFRGHKKKWGFLSQGWVRKQKEPWAEIGTDLR